MITVLFFPSRSYIGYRSSEQTSWRFVLSYRRGWPTERGGILVGKSSENDLANGFGKSPARHYKASRNYRRAPRKIKQSNCELAREVRTSFYGRRGPHGSSSSGSSIFAPVISIVDSEFIARVREAKCAASTIPRHQDGIRNGIEEHELVARLCPFRPHEVEVAGAIQYYSHDGTYPSVIRVLIAPVKRRNTTAVNLRGALLLMFLQPSGSANVAVFPPCTHAAISLALVVASSLLLFRRLHSRKPYFRFTAFI
ncbi:hypothetical protein Trydic_g23883 [Trypoxylus dichotomus]